MSAHVKASEAPSRPHEQPAAGTPSTAYRTGTLGAEALCLAVPIRAVGSRAFADPGGQNLPCEPFEEESITMLLHPRGAVIRLASPVARGQDVMLINKWTNKCIHGRVANIRTSPEVKRYVEVEFTHTAPNFWGISFPKEAAKAAAAELPPEVPVAPPTESHFEVPWVVPKKARAAAVGEAPAKAAVVAPVLAPERAVAIPMNAPTALPETDEAVSPAPFFLPRPTPAIPVCEPVLAQAEAEAEAEAAPVSSPFVSSPLMKWEAFSIPIPERRRSGVLRATVATAMVCAVFLAYRIHSAMEEPLTDPQNASSPIADSFQPAAMGTSVTVPAVAVTKSQSEAPAGAMQPTGPSATPAQESVSTVNAPAPEVARVEPPRRLVLLVSKMTLPVHNITIDPHNAPPELPPTAGQEPATAGPQPDGETPGKAVGLLPAAGLELPPPPELAPVPENSGKLGDSVTPARLVTSVQPIYPFLAKQGHIEGNVTFEVQIDASGNVTGTKVLSGPQALREAAANALAKWKFQPARLRDQPIPSTTIVTLRFRLR